MGLAYNRPDFMKSAYPGALRAGAKVLLFKTA